MNWAPRRNGEIPGRVQAAKKIPTVFVRRELIGSSHPSVGMNASSLLTDARRCSKSWMASGLGKPLIP
jgi:hypothetical protein